MAGRRISTPSSVVVERRWLAAAVVGLLLFLAAAASVVVDGGLTRLDAPVSSALEPTREGAREFALALATLGGSFVILVLIATLAGIFAFQRRWWAVGRVTLIPVAGELLVRTLKIVFARPRPPGADLLASDFSFPSGHATNAAILACLLAWTAFRHRDRTGVLVLLGVAGGWLVLMALDRLVLDVHHFTDVVGGAGLGVFVAGAGLAASNWAQRALAPRRGDH